MARGFNLRAPGTAGPPGRTPEGIPARTKVIFRKKTFDQLGENFGKKILAEEERIRKQAAEEATRKSRQVFESKRSQREFTAKRAGRPTTRGQFSSYIEWFPWPNDAGVGFDYGKLEDKAPYWIIQEVGTGKSYQMLEHLPGDEKPSVVDAGSIKKQQGRLIPGGLAWGDSSGNYHRPQHGRRTDQIHPVAKLSIAKTEVKKARGAGRTKNLRSTAMLRTPQVQIRKEIKGKHFVKAGGVVGARLYRNQLLAAAEKTLRKRQRG